MPGRIELIKSLLQKTNSNLKAVEDFKEQFYPIVEEIEGNLEKALEMSVKDPKLHEFISKSLRAVDDLTGEFFKAFIDSI
jgi:hypothetical protein